MLLDRDQRVQGMLKWQADVQTTLSFALGLRYRTVQCMHKRLTLLSAFGQDIDDIRDRE